MLKKYYHFQVSSLSAETDGTTYTFLDIETTGLKRDTTILYLIGCGWQEQGELHILQWFNDDGVSEPAMLLALTDFLSKHPTTLFTFNGDSFDIPYLNRHYELHEMDYHLPASDSLDLYRALRPFQALFHLSSGKQKDWEQFLGIEREDRYNGGQLIQFYKMYLRTRDEELLSLLLLHNMEDIRGMAALLPLTAYPSLLSGDFAVDSVSVQQEDSFTVVCQLPSALPKLLAITADLPVSSAQMRVENHRMYLTIPLVRASLKYFYPDYKNYYYLPQEDRAIHKSVGCYVDSSFREKATPATCYVRKEGLFAPCLPREKYKGIETGLQMYSNTLTLYKREYKDSCSFAELPSLLQGDSNCLYAYVNDWMKGILISEMKR